MIVRCILYICLAISSSLVHTYHIIPRKNTDDYDPFIVCEGLGPTHEEGLPTAYSEQLYSLNINLCSATHGVSRHNVGCACAHAQANVRCSQNLADPNLWNAMYQSLEQSDIEEAIEMGHSDGRTPFYEYCGVNCLCVEPVTAHDSVSNTTLAASVIHRFRAAELARQRQSESTTQINPFTGGALITSGNFPNVDHTLNGQCGNNCTSDRDCNLPVSPTENGEAAVKGSKCTCRAQSSQYEPGSGTVAFVAACLINMATGGKREEAWPCPCNSSYVSHGCCGTQDGLVWEAPENKLGELVH